MNKIEAAANQAVFQLQLNTNEAVRYIRHQAGCGRDQALAALKSVSTFHKN